MWLFKLTFFFFGFTNEYRTCTIISRSWLQAIHKDRIFWKNLLKNKETVFGNGVKNIQVAAYNGVRTLLWCSWILTMRFFILSFYMFKTNKQLNDDNNHRKWIQPFVKPFLEGISGKSKTNDLEKNRNKGSSFNVQQYNNKFYAINVALGRKIC